MPIVAPIYAGLLAVLFSWLSLRVSLIRMKGPAPDEAAATRLRRAVRAQGNASEYIPLGLILLLVLDLQGAPFWLVHVFGLALLAGRIGHFVSFTLPSTGPLIRVSMLVTYVMICFSGLFVLYYALV
ncbi:MAG: MAPEG family protein [Rhodobacteraceae bacterium]|nr:MAPEG family protein [Paracoccaceae bacterium]